MRQRELLQVLQTRPFRPFRIHVTDGAVYDIHHPDLVMTARAYAIVGSPATGGAPPAIERHDIVDLLHITRLEPIESSASQADSA
jgi:hypothetical protein